MSRQPPTWADLMAAMDRLERQLRWLTAGGLTLIGLLAGLTLASWLRSDQTWLDRLFSTGALLVVVTLYAWTRHERRQLRAARGHRNGGGR